MQLESPQWPAGAWDEMEGERGTATEREKRECWGRAGGDLPAVCHPFWLLMSVAHPVSP